ncbi:AAA family ATPase [Paraburkholderia sp. MMS20-SJTN17]|uniref:AAA family ATPase n=1 Tax=Paraburkholderia translucens TaxID=2886945 RepID=A0ABS8KLX0_9BURK|nr:AAA family ATPase [Paraburkholderia sp. MMS20-SJTN17]MCC8405756.1 AAA family ATPase [Paraburkholderia sp. MMS20-SJTN17]
MTMLTTFAVSNYRSIRNLVLPLTSLNLITGANGSGKSNLYRALRLLSETSQDGVIAPLAREGGMKSTMWAGPESISRAMRRGETSVQGGPRKHAHRLKLGFSGDAFGYAVTLGLKPRSQSVFSLDPEFKRECIWAGPYLRPATLLVDRQGSLVRRRVDGGWDVVTHQLPTYESLFSHLGRDRQSPEVLEVREVMRSWRFYDHFRTDAHAPARQSQLGTHTPVMHHDGRDVAAAVQTIREIGDAQALDEAIDDAFPGSRVDVKCEPGGLFTLTLHQHGLLRPLCAAELSDGTLRYLLLVAALLTPRPPSLMVLNEPESSLHPDLLPALGRLIIRASAHSQVWVVSHSTRLAASIESHPQCNVVELTKELSETAVTGQMPLDRPAWYWPDKDEP